MESFMMANSINFSLRVINTMYSNNGEFNSIDFSANGQYLVTSTVEDQVALYNCMNGMRTKVYTCKKYGSSIVRYVCSDDSLIHSSTKINHAIRYVL